MADRAAESRLFGHLPVTVIPNGLDTDRYRPQDKRLARRLLGLPADDKIVLFCCNEALSFERKGFAWLVEALKRLASGQKTRRWCLVVVGVSSVPKGYDFTANTRFLGHLKDDVSLALAYSAADVYAIPTMEDNLPNTVMEAMACATPCVAFRSGGIPDMVDHLENGFLSAPKDVEGLAEGLRWLLSERVRYRRIAENARKKSETCFDHRIQAERYRELFRHLVNESAG
jgi:glycosyltransferase involved in cell wall biosynthesis